MKTIQLMTALFLFAPFCSPAQDPVVVPFRQVGNLIVLEARVDGRPGAFILDTGAGDIVLNAAYFSGSGHSAESIRDINGQQFQLMTDWVDLELGQGLLRQDEKAYIVDLSHPEQKLGCPIHGKLGTRFFRGTELEIDYGKRLLTIYHLDRKGEPVGEAINRPEPMYIMEFKMKGHIPYLTTALDGKNLRLGLDTGAEVNVLSERVAAPLKNHLSEDAAVAVGAMGDNPARATLCQLVVFDMDQITYGPMSTVLLPHLPFNDHLPGPRLDGLLGYPFLRHHLTAINFAKREVAFRELRQGARRKTVVVEN